MDLRKTEIYDTFTCIADRCPLTCCQEWKISVDEDTHKRWNRIKTPEAANIGKSNLSRFIMQKDGEEVIELNSQRKCVFLNKKGLCHLVTAYGDEVLSETCKSFPRVRHIHELHQEKSLSASCPVVIDLLWKLPGILQIVEEQVEISYVEEKVEEDIEEIICLDEDSAMVQVRDMAIFILQKEEYSVQECLLMIFYIMLDWYKRENVAKKDLEMYCSPENRKELITAIRDIPIEKDEVFMERNEILQDITVNYQSQHLYERYLCRWLPLADHISNEEQPQKYQKDQEEFQVAWKPFERLMRNYLIQEIFTNLWIPGSDRDSMMLQMEWIAMEVGVMYHTIFLDFLQKKTLDYEMVRESISVVSRMTGYNEEDIQEYMDECFEERIWDWGYFALVVGNDR